MTLFPTTVQRASCRVRKLICTGELPTTVISIVLVAVLHVFCGYSSALSPNILSEVKVEVAVLDLMVSAGDKQQGTCTRRRCRCWNVPAIVEEVCCICHRKQPGVTVRP